MNEAKMGTSPSQQKVLTAFFDRLTVISDRIEKIRYRFDDVCDSIDYSEYYKNRPQEESDAKCDPSSPDASDAKFTMEKILERLEREEYKLGMAVDFIEKFI